jgi:hypothetical protein
MLLFFKKKSPWFTLRYFDSLGVHDTKTKCVNFVINNLFSLSQQVSSHFEALFNLEYADIDREK